MNLDFFKKNKFNIFLHSIQIGAIIFLIFFTDNTHDHNYNFAKSRHSHNYADNRHTHDATEITYKSFSYGGYGTLQKEIKSLADHRHDLGYSSYAEKNHTHDAYDCGCAKKYHTHY